MTDIPVEKRIENKLKNRWPQLMFTVIESANGNSIDIQFDKIARTREEDLIRKYVDKFMGVEFPNYQYVVSRVPF